MALSRPKHGFDSRWSYFPRVLSSPVSSKIPHKISTLGLNIVSNVVYRGPQFIGGKNGGERKNQKGGKDQNGGRSGLKAIELGKLRLRQSRREST